MIWAAITLGLLANLHCVGMCGPIALALPIGRLTNAQKVISVLSYNLGRILIYTLLGVILGLFGSGLQLVGLLQTLSIVMGVILILQGLNLFKILKFKKSNTPGKILSYIKDKFAHHLKKRSVDAFFMMGVFNGLLPCGMVYTALIASLLLGNWIESSNFMFFFGLGTLPTMILMPFIGNFFGSKVKSFYNKILPYTLLILGIIFILRGSNLGLPYLSPALDTDVKAFPSQTINCH